MNITIKSPLSLHKNTLRVNPSITVAGLLFLLRNYITSPLTAEEALYLFYDGRLVPMTCRLRDLSQANSIQFELMREATFGV